MGMSHPRWANIDSLFQPCHIFAALQDHVRPLSPLLSHHLCDRACLLPGICPLPLQLPLKPCAVLSAGNIEFSIPRAPGFCEGLIGFFKPISVLILNCRHRQSPSLPRGLPSDPKHNAALSSFSNFVENNHQTPAETLREALRRYFSSCSCHNILSDQSSVEASIAAHKAQAQAAIDAVDAVMDE